MSKSVAITNSKIDQINETHESSELENKHTTQNNLNKDQLNPNEIDNLDQLMAVGDNDYTENHESSFGHRNLNLKIDTLTSNFHITSQPLSLNQVN